MFSKVLLIVALVIVASLTVWSAPGAAVFVLACIGLAFFLGRMVELDSAEREWRRGRGLAPSLLAAAARAEEDTLGAASDPAPPAGGSNTAGWISREVHSR